MSKVCGKCKEKKPLTEFHVRKLAVDGRQNACKECVSARSRRRYVEKWGGDSEEILSLATAWPHPRLRLSQNPC